MRQIRSFIMKKAACVVLMLSLSVVSQARAEDARIRALTPFLDNDVLGVGHVDLTKVDLEKLAHCLIADKEQAGELVGTVTPWLSALRKAGAKEIYTLVILPELLSPSVSPFPAIVPLEQGADANAIGELLCGRGGAKGPVCWPTCAT